MFVFVGVIVGFKCSLLKLRKISFVRFSFWVVFFGFR